MRILKRLWMYMVMLVALVGACGLNSLHDDSAASKVKLSSKKVTVAVGGTKTLKLKGVNKKKVTWKTKNKKIATVNKNGKIVGKAKGKTKIYAQVKGKSKKYTCTVTVKEVSLNYQKIYLNKGDSQKLKVNGAKASDVQWKSKNKNIATVNKDGKVVGKKKGQTKIYATIYGKKLTCDVVVVPKSEPVKEDVETTEEESKDDTEEKTEEKKTSVAISADKTVIDGYGTIQFTKNVTYSGKTVRYEGWQIVGGDNKIGTVDENGKFTSNGLPGSMTVSYIISEYWAEGSEATVSTCSNQVTITVNDNFTYEIYPLSNFYNDSMYATDWSSSGSGAVYVKTNDTTLKDIVFMVCDKSGNQVSGSYSVEFNPYTFTNLSGQYKDGYWLNDGGLTAVAWTAGMKVEAGDYYLTLAKYIQIGGGVQYESLAQTPIHIYDTEEELERWMDDFLATYTTDDMNVHQKMEKMVEYMNSYYFCAAGAVRTQDVGLTFLSGISDSHIPSQILSRFGDYIGYKVWNEYNNNSGKTIQHGRALGTYDGVDYIYYVKNGVESGATAGNDNPVRIPNSLQDLIDSYKNQWIEE